MKNNVMEGRLLNELQCYKAHFSLDNTKDAHTCTCTQLSTISYNGQMKQSCLANQNHLS